MEKYDVIVIGGGPAGYPSAIRCAQKGLKVCLVEEKEIGGVCLNKGCIPTKTLVRISKEVEPTGTKGVKKTTSFSWKEVLTSIKTDVILRLRTGVNFLLKQNGIDVLNEKGIFLEQGKVEAGEKTIEGNNIVLATGSSPSIPKIFHGDERVITSDDFWNMETLPESMAIVGGGAIGCEFASIMNKFGVSVSIYEMCDSLLPGKDKEIVKLLTNSLIKKGINVYVGKHIENLNEITEEKILLSIGRIAITEDLYNKGIEIEKSGVNTNAKLQTNIKNVYAVGDINGKYPLAYVATKEGEIAAENISGNEILMDYKNIPEAIFTDPEIGSCGITEEEAKEKNIKVKIGKFPYQALGRAYADGKITGLFKVIEEEETGKMLGIHIIGEKTTELVSFATLAIKNNLKSENLEKILYCHPTFAEGIMEAVADLQNKSIHLPPPKKK